MRRYYEKSGPWGVEDGRREGADSLGIVPLLLWTLKSKIELFEACVVLRLKVSLLPLLVVNKVYEARVCAKLPILQSTSLNEKQIDFPIKESQIS